MDFEQIVKRLEWLDEEHRKDKAAIIELEERIAAYEGQVDVVAKQIRPLEKQIEQLTPASARIDQFEKLNAKQREEIKAAVEEVEKKYQKREKELLKQLEKDYETLHKEVDELKKSLTEIPNLRRELKSRTTEEGRIQQEIKDLKAYVDNSVRVAEEAKSAQKAFEESRKLDIKRTADVQGELAALRKRIDEARTKVDTSADSMKHVDTRIKELMSYEAARKAEQTEFIEKQSVAQIDRERAFKEWRSKYEEFQSQIGKLDTHSLALDDTLKAAKRAQETYNELNVKLERRINEVTEMQRLAEERLRQEWVTFKADDQKRWTGHTLAQDEGTKDIRKSVQKLDERIVALDESFQVTQDQLHQTTDATEQQLQELMNVAHEWLSAYERIMGHGKTTKKSKKQ